MYLNDALACTTAIEAVVCQHEQACGIAAEAYGRTDAEENPGFGVAMVTTGPGATNLITAVAGAWIDSIPMLIVSGQAKRADRLNGRRIRQGGVQEVDIVPIVSSITKYAVTVEDPASIRLHLEKALCLMRSGRPGPVWLDIPLDVQATPIDSDHLLPLDEAVEIVGGVEPSDLSDLIGLLQKSERPLLLAGHGVRLSGAAKRFPALVEQLNVPAVLTWNALDLLPHDHPLNIGRPGVVAARAPNFAVQNCDLLIAIGARLDNVVTAYNLQGFARNALKVICDIDQSELDDKQCFEPEMALSVDAAQLIDGLLDSGISSCMEEWANQCRDWKTRYPQNEGGAFPDKGPIGHAHFVESLSEAIPENTLVTCGSSGLAVEFFFAGFRNKAGQRTFLTSGLGAMGYGLPAAIGACLGNNMQPMVAVESDGSLQLNLQELATLVGYQLPICLLVMNNNGYASIRNTQRTHFQSRFVGTEAESGLYMPDLESLASTYGIPFLSIADCENLIEALRDAHNLPRPCMIEIRLVGDEILQPKCATIPRSDGTIVSMPLEDMSPLLSLQDLESEMLTPILEESRRARS
jgi:acetolactate synthase-1/2/3 large subunit